MTQHRQKRTRVRAKGIDPIWSQPCSSVTLLFPWSKREAETETWSGFVPKVTLSERDPRVGVNRRRGVQIGCLSVLILHCPGRRGGQRVGNRAELNIVKDDVQCLTSCFSLEVKLVVLGPKMADREARNWGLLPGSTFTARLTVELPYLSKPQFPYL